MARVQNPAAGFAAVLRRLFRRDGAGAATPETPAEQEESVWDRIAAIGEKIPDEDLARWPKDGARNFDHYIDGAPRQD